MSNVYSHMTMSLDGYIADPKDRCDELFDWYGAGDVTVPTAVEGSPFHVDEHSAALLREVLDGAGALVCGRRLFDLTQGWGDNHPIGAPVVVVTHQPPPDADRWPRTSFVDGVPAAIAAAKETACGKDVSVASANVAQQALEAGLLDGIYVSLVPVLLGDGIPYFANLAAAPYRLADPVVIEGKRATHLRYTIRR
jgi:dihydrofolate reductase